MSSIMLLKLLRTARDSNLSPATSFVTLQQPDTRYISSKLQKVKNIFTELKYYQKIIVRH